MGRKRRRTKKRKQKNSKGSGGLILISVLIVLFLAGKFGWWIVGFALAIPAIKYLYERHTASVKGKPTEPPKIPSPLTVTYQIQPPAAVHPPQVQKISVATSKEDIEKIAIQLARQFDGCLTPIELSSHTSLSLDEANKALEQFVRKGHAHITTTEKGSLLYKFPGLLMLDKNPSPNEGRQKAEQEASQPQSLPTSPPAPKYTLVEEPVIVENFSEDAATSDRSILIHDYTILSEEEEAPIPEELSEHWVAPGKSISIHGYTLSDGMVYVTPTDSISLKNEPSVIKSSLPIKPVSYYGLGPIGYFPSYDELEPEARAMYLTWLAGGRNDQPLDIGYVFLFFYGLERRVLVDIHKSPVFQHELPSIIAEIKRLLSIYHANQSFYHYATSFLTFISAKYQPEQIKVTKDDLKDRTEFPFALKYALAQFAEKGQPLPAPLAFTWFERSPHATLRTPAKRCRTEFFNLFKLRYHAEFGKGLVIESHAQHWLSVEYTPANASLRGQTYFYELEGFLDVSPLVEPITAFQKIVDACIEDLEPFSRYLGRKSNQTRPNIFALAQLPAELLTSANYPEITSLRGFVESAITSNDLVIVETSELFAAMQFASEEALSQSESLMIVELLGQLGYGIEPDVRFHGQRLAPQKKSVVFKLLASQAHTASAEYTFALLLLTLSALVVHADGVVNEREEEHLRTHLAARLMLTPGERQRLSAHLALLLIEPPSLQAVKKHVASLSKDSKYAIAEFLIALSTTDGHVAPEEVDMLKKLYSLLELDNKSLYAAIHAKQTRRNIVAGDTPQRSDVSFSETAGQADIGLDMNLIAQTLQQTEQVHALLADVFEETPEGSPASPQVLIHPEQAIHTLPHLDSHHTALFDQIAHLECISLDDFTILCKQFDVLPGGAIETLNTAAFEVTGEALIEEDGEMLLLVQDIAKEMKT